MKSTLMTVVLIIWILILGVTLTESVPRYNDCNGKGGVLVETAHGDFICIDKNAIKDIK